MMLSRHLIICRAVYLVVHFAHFIAFSIPFHYSIIVVPSYSKFDKTRLTISRYEYSLESNNLMHINLFFIRVNIKHCYTVYCSPFVKKFKHVYLTIMNILKTSFISSLK